MTLAAALDALRALAPAPAPMPAPQPFVLTDEQVMAVDETSEPVRAE